MPKQKDEQKGAGCVMKKLMVKMFGGFSASYGDEVLTFGRQKDSKFGQLFQILMTRPGQGFGKKDIAEKLYGGEEVEDSNASLNNTIFRLRKYLEASPLPSGNYLELKDGVLRFGGELQTESDVWSFEKASREFQEEQDDEKKADLCRKACELYQGEFLPQLSNEMWVIERGRNYQKLYFRMLKYLLNYLKEAGDYKNVERAAGHAAALYPYEGWEIWQINSMIAMGLHEDAEKTYRKMAVHMQETGGFLSKKQQDRFYEIGSRLRQPEGTEEEIGRCLMESAPEGGAYACTLPGFSDCFRMLRRGMMRGGQVSFSLLLCTILDAGGHPVSDREYLKKHGRKLCESFRTYLRKGDTYTKYSEGQYLLLCVGAAGENAAEIGARIDMDYRKRCGGRGGISCRLLDDGTMW